MLEVAKCGDCHSPTKISGEIDRSNWLKGARPIAAAVECSNSSNPAWTLRDAPLLRTCRLTNFAPHDAEAIVAYLEALK